MHTTVDTWAASEAMLIREVLLLTGLEVRAELLLDSAVARGICRREGAGTVCHLSTKVLSVGETRSGHGWSVYIRRELRRHGDNVIACPQTWRQPRQWNGLVLDQKERLATGDKEYHLRQNDYSFDALQAYCFGININL